jgi:hypothetical protein
MLLLLQTLMAQECRINKGMALCRDKGLCR